MTFALYGENEAFRLRLASLEDAENLRVWKNDHKQFFFYQQDITAEQQLNWMKRYLADKDNFMFIVEAAAGEDWVGVGCMGYRLEEAGIDLYNILRGVKREDPFSMGEAFKLMCAYVARTYALPAGCVVLKDNPARAWYEKLGMHAVGEGSRDGLAYVDYRLDPASVAKVAVVKEAL